MTTKSKTNGLQNRSRQGVGMIIGGVILAAILFTSVYYYFYVIMEGQVIRGETDAKIQQLENSKKLENIEVTSFKNEAADTISIRVKNIGTIPVKIDYVITYDKSSIPVGSDATSEKKDIGLNPGHDVVVESGIAADKSKTYRIDAITERGNVVTAMWPPVDATSSGSDVLIKATVSAFGSLQLDFKSLGVIFHDRSSVHEPTIRSSVDQRGWHLKFGNTTGYPAFLLPGDTSSSSNPNNPEAIVLRVRNVDPSGEDMLLHATTGLGITLADSNENKNSVVFLCWPGAKEQFEPYKETPGKQYILPNALVKGLSDESTWTYLYFCDGVPGTTPSHNAISEWQAKKFPVDLNPIIMTARGEFIESYQQYGQTFPYQAVTVTDDSFSACLKSGPSIDPNIACPNTLLDKYKAPAGDEVWVYYSTPASSDPTQEITVLWLNPDGEIQRLTSPTESSNPFKIRIPNTNIDGSPVLPKNPDGTMRHYIIQVIDENRNIDSMTFEITAKS